MSTQPHDVPLTAALTARLRWSWSQAVRLALSEPVPGIFQYEGRSSERRVAPEVHQKDTEHSSHLYYSTSGQLLHSKSSPRVWATIVQGEIRRRYSSALEQPADHVYTSSNGLNTCSSEIRGASARSASGVQCQLTSKTGHRAKQEGHVDTRPCVAAVACECATGAAEDTNGEGSIRDCVEQDDVRA